MASVALSLAPKFVPALINRCWAHLGFGYLDEALKDCNAAIEVDPKNPLALNNRGAVYAQQGDLEKALLDYEQACLGGSDLSCNNFKNIRGYSPKDKLTISKNLLDEARQNFADKKWNLAIDGASKVINLIPDNLEAHITRSGAYANAGFLELALADIEMAIRLNPNDGMAYNNRGFVYEMKKDLRQATLQYSMACRLKIELGCMNLTRIK